MTYYGDFPINHPTVCMVFDSFASTGASVAPTGFAASDIVVFKDGGTTQRTSTAGITVSTSFDGLVGLQMVVIDLSDNTDAGFYVSGHEYQVVVSDVTVDGQVVRFWLGSFSIERYFGALYRLSTRLANLDFTVRAIARGTVGSSASTTSLPTSAFVPAGAAADQFRGRVVLFDVDTTTVGLRGCARLISATTNASTPTLTVDALPTTPVSGDKFSVI